MTRAGGSRGDRWAATVAGGLVALAALVAWLSYLEGRPVHATAAPIFGHWLPHAGPGTPIAVLMAGLVVWRGPELARRLRWRPLLALAYGASVVWILALALIDGWQRGLAGRLTTRFEYLAEVDGVTDVHALLRGFTGRILDGGPDPWTTHVAGHPPGALLVFVGLDRLGLGGGGWAALACVLAGAAVAVAVPVTLRACGDEAAARTAVPFLVLFPGAVWIGVSADGLFAGVAAVGLALLAIGVTRRSPIAAGAAGVVLAGAAYLSYGLVLLAPLVLVVVLGARRWHPLVWTALGAAGVVVAFQVSGFSWLEGYHLVGQRYYQGLASQRPYAYWVWADLAALMLCAGPAAAPILRRAVLGARGVLRRRTLRAVRAVRAVRAAGAVRVAGAAGAVRVAGAAGAVRVAGAAGDVRAPTGIGKGSAQAAEDAVDASRGGVVIGRESLPGGVVVGRDSPPGVLAIRRTSVLAAAVRQAHAVLRPVAAAIRRAPAVLLPLAAAVAIAVADLSGLSKAEVERIWLPFAVWLPAGAALLPAPGRRGWLAAQAATALLVNHLLLTGW